MAPLSSNAAQLNQPTSNKNVKRKSSSKPIINWLQRKIATVRPRNVSEGSRPDSNQMKAKGAEQAGSTVKTRNGGKPYNVRITDENTYATARGRPDVHRSLSNEISLNSIGSHSEDDLESTRRSSGAAGSLWSRSNQLEADDDASTRPLPPTSPPSPSPSRSSSSYLSDPRTFKSLSISTKPTTVLSVDLTTNGMAHIAQAPPTPTSVHNTHMAGPLPRFPHARTSSTGPGASITFSALPPSPQSSRPPSINPSPLRSSALQAPSHTAHHPRNNPRPSSPPLDNASMLTLASSAFGVSPPFSGGQRSGYSFARGADDSASHLGLGAGGDSLSVILRSGVDDSVLAVDDREASLRALRPRSSRRGSWESEASRWSAGVGSMLGNLAGGRSVRTAPSYRTGGQGTMDDMDEVGDIGSVSLADDDGVSVERDDDNGATAEDGEYGSSNRDRALSPTSSLSIDPLVEEAMDEREMVKSATEDGVESTDVDESALSVKSHKLEHDHDDLATPAVKSVELAAEPETTPKKERAIGVLEDVPDVPVLILPATASHFDEEAASTENSLIGRASD